MLLRLIHLMLFSVMLTASAQVDTAAPDMPFTIKPAAYIIPSAMIVYGFVALKSPALIKLNQNVKQAVWVNNPHQPFHLDDYTVFAPAVAVYGLNIAGVKGKHNFVDRSFLYGISMLVSTAFVVSTKNLTKELRPDSSNRLSFPSGHTSSAFVAAEFLRQEYKHLSPWYGIAGYAVAATTGYLRMYNNKHWLSDVLAGAAVGILSVQAAYWIYPKIKQKFTAKKGTAWMILPYYQQQSGGLVLLYQY